MGEMMIERLAETIGDAMFRELGSPSDWCPPEGAMQAVARATLGAMREPTDAMIRAAGSGPADRSCWQRIIDAALEEG